MARIIYGALATSIHGSVGGTTFQRNAYGHTIKNKNNMVDPNSTFQNTQKLILAKAVKAWGALTDAQRNTWNTFASAHPQFAKNNPSSQLSGYSVYVRRNVFNFLEFGLNQPALQNCDNISYNLDTCTLHLKLVGGVLTLNMTWALATEDLDIMVFASNTFAPSQLFVGSNTRYMGANTNNNDPLVITAKYLANYGALPPVGSFVVIELVAAGSDNGQVFSRSSQRLTVAAS